MEQGQADGSETTTQAQGNLGNPNQAANLQAGPGSGVIQSRPRQLTQKL